MSFLITKRIRIDPTRAPTPILFLSIASSVAVDSSLTVLPYCDT